MAGFIFLHTDTPKTCPVLGASLCRRTFRGVCNTPLHGYAQNPPGFRPKPSSRGILGRMQYAPTRVRAKFDGFHISTHVPTQILPDFRPKPLARNIWGRMLLRPYTGTSKTRRVLDFATRHGAKPGGFWTLPHDIARNPAGFGLCHSTWRETRRVLDFATRHSAKPGGFFTLPHDMARNPAGFSHCYTT